MGIELVQLLWQGEKRQRSVTGDMCQRHKRKSTQR